MHGMPSSAASGASGVTLARYSLGGTPTSLVKLALNEPSEVHPTATHTSVTLLHSEGFTPPKLGLLVLFGGSTRDRKSGLYETRLTLHAGARGMNCEKLAKRIGDFFAAAQARHELRRMQAD